MTSFSERRAALVRTADAAGLPAALSALTDAWLAERFATEAVECGLANANEAGSGVALVAVGGYGRGELCPGSDIDLLLLHDDIDTGNLADRLWYPIWDEKLKLGHAVRSLAGTLELAASDTDTATALVDARHLAGDESLTERLTAGVKADWRDNASGRLDELQRAVSRRHSQSGEVAFLLEPDLKTGRGGLRDAHAIRWARLAGAELPAADNERLNEAYQTLLRARVDLHRTTGLRSGRALCRRPRCGGRAIQCGRRGCLHGRHRTGGTDHCVPVRPAVVICRTSAHQLHRAGCRHRRLVGS